MTVQVYFRFIVMTNREPMIKFFRKIRQKMLTQKKFNKYLLYAIGEILLVVIGILIALQLNNWNENKNKTELGYKYLAEMKSELQDDVFKLDFYITELKQSIKNQESALNTKDITKLPLDSLLMIISPINLDFKMSELTYNKMNNLGITSLSNNDNLNSIILKYYNQDLERLKSSMNFVFNDLITYQNFFYYDQNKIDISSAFDTIPEFPSLYKQGVQEDKRELKFNIIEFIQSPKGRSLVLYDLDGKRYSLETLNTMQGKTTNLLKAVYNELKSYDPKTECLPTLPLSAVDIEN